MEKSTKGLIILATPLLIGFLFGFLVGNCSGSHHATKKMLKAESNSEVVAASQDMTAEDTADSSEEYEEPQQKEIIYYTKTIPYSTYFNDLNDAHVELAKAVGLSKVPKNREDVVIKKLTHIKSNELYMVDTLRYSIPFLTKSAAAEIGTIGKAFTDSLKSKNFPEYKIIVSSVLRTQDDIDRLRRSGNPNASDNSAHCYGTTFDITYSRYYREVETDEFMQPYELTKVLAEVLRDQKESGRIIVKYEHKERCFHITAK